MVPETSACHTLLPSEAKSLAFHRCKPTDPNYQNGGCISGLTCSASTSKCSSIPAGSNCDGKDNECGAGYYCDAAKLCSVRKPINSPCSSNLECEYQLICTDRKVDKAPFQCLAPFVRLAGESCRNEWECSADLECDKDICTLPVVDGQRCETDESLCPGKSDCVCEAKRSNDRIEEQGIAFCENDADNVFTSSEIKAFKDMQNCLAEKGCHDYWASVLVLDLQSGPDQCIASCIRSGFKTTFEKAGDSYNSCNFNSAAALLPGLFALLGVIIVAFLL